MAGVDDFSYKQLNYFIMIIPARFFILTGIFILCQAASGFTAKVTIPASLATDTLRFVPQGTPDPEEGRLYYDGGQNQFTFYDGSGWQILGGAADSRAASIIIAAWNSLGSVKPGTSTLCDGNGSECVNPKADYTCDGASDGSTINSAIASLDANAGTVYLLEGTYDNNGVAFTARSNISIIGAGPATVLRQKGGTSNGIIVTNSDHISVSNLTLDGSGMNPNAIILEGLVTTLTRDCVFDNIRIINGGSVIMRNVTGNTISNIDIDNGSIFMDSASRNIITHNSINSGSGIYLIKFSGNNNSDYNIISHNRVRNCSAGIHIGVDPAGNFSGGAHNNSVSYNHVDSISNSVAQIRSDGSCYNRIAYNTVKDSPNGGGILIRPYDAWSGLWLTCGSIVSGNRISNSLYWGLSLVGPGPSGTAGNNIVTDNLLFDNAAVFGSSQPFPYYDVYGELRASGSNGNILSGNFIFNLPCSGSGFGYAHNAIKFENSSNNYYSGNYIYWLYRDQVIYIPGSNSNIWATGLDKITLEPGGYTGLVNGGVLTPVGPVSYMQLLVTPPGNQPIISSIVSGNPGDILIVQSMNFDSPPSYANIPSNSYVMFPWPSTLNLDQGDTATFIYDGTRWVRISACLW